MALPIAHLEKVRALVVSGRTLVVGGTRASAGTQMTFYDRVAERPERSVDVPAHVLALAAAGETIIAACSDGALRVYRVKDGGLVRELVAHAGASATAVAIEGDRILSAGTDGRVASFSLAKGAETGHWALSPRPLRAVAIDATGESFAAAGDDGTVRVVPIAGGAAREMSGHDGGVTSLVFAPTDGRLVSAGEDGTVRLWYLAGAVEADVRGRDESAPAGGVLALAILPSAPGARDALCAAGSDGKIRRFNTFEKRRPRTLETASAEITALAAAPARKPSSMGVLYAGGAGRTIFAYDLDVAGQPEAQSVRYAHGFSVLEEAIAAPARATRETALKKLASLGEPEALELAERVLRSDREPDLRALAARELAANARRDARRAFRERLADDQAAVRAAVLEAWRALEADAPLAPLRAALEAKAPDLRIAALRALAGLGTSPLARGLVLGRVADDDADVRRTALATWIGLHPAGGEPLRTAFERGRADVRAEVLVRAAVGGLAAAPEIAPLVGRGLDDEDADVRRVAFVLSTFARPALAAWLHARDEFFARAVADLAKRVVWLDTGARGVEPKPEEIDAARGRLGMVKESALAEGDREPFLAAMACRSADTSLRGARGLAFLGDMRALGALLQLSREADPGLRREAARALVALEDPRAKKRLVWMLNDAEAPVRDAALEALGKLEKEPLDLAEAALRSASEDVRVRGLGMLVARKPGDTRAQALLGDSLEDESAKVRGDAFRTLWSWHGGDPLPPIDRALAGRFPDLRVRAIAELAALAKPPTSSGPARTRLAAAIADRDLGVARAAYDATLELRGKEDPETHLAALASSHAALRAQGAKDARKAPADRVRSALLKALEDAEAAVRTASIESLDALFPQDAAPLYVGLQSSHLDLRVAAAELLAARRDERVIDPMRALLADTDLAKRIPPAILVLLRRRAATALASVGSTKLLGYFGTELVKDEDPIVREQAARGLANASRRGEEGHLLDLLGHAEVAIRSWAADGLSRLGDVRALPVLTGTLRHEHAPIRVGAILSFAALGPEGYGGMLQGLEDPAREVQRIVLSIVLARDLRAFRASEPPELLTSALSAAEPEVRFAAARALELRIEPAEYAAHLVEMLLPDRPERAADMAGWPDEDRRAHLVIALAEAIAGDRPEQRYAAAQALRLRERPLDFFREVDRVVRPRSVGSPWIPETMPKAPSEPPASGKGPLGWVRKLFAGGTAEGAKTGASSPVPPDQQKQLRMLAFGAYVGLLRQSTRGNEEGHRVRRDAIERIVELAAAGHVTIASATPPLARALDDANHLVRRAAFAALQKVHANDPDVPLALALASGSEDVVRGALDLLAARGDAGTARIARALDSGVADARRYAFELLEKLHPKGSLEPLLAAIASEHADVRIGVLERLATSQDPRVLAALGKALESDHDDLRLRAAEMLASRRDDRAVDVLSAALRADDAAIATRAREALARLGSERGVRALALRIDEAPDAERLALVEALRKSRGALAIDPLAVRFGDERVDVRAAAFAACISIAGPRSDAPASVLERTKPRDPALTLRFLSAASRSIHADVRLLAARELDEVPGRASVSGSPRSVGDLETQSPTDRGDADAVAIALFADRDSAVRAAAVEAFARRVEKKGAPVAPLEAVLRGGARETMLAAAEGLAGKKNGAAFRPLVLFVRAGEPGERERALLALGTLGDARGLAELETVASGGTEEAPVEPSMQAAALEALGRLLPALADADAKERVRDRIESSVGTTIETMAVAALRALRWVLGERSRARIEGVLASSGSRIPERDAAARALGEMADPAAELVLARALGDDAPIVRATAREALDRLFPTERTRVELHAVESLHPDVSLPAAAFLASAGDAALLLGKLARIAREDLRQRIRFGLARRESLPVDPALAVLADPGAGRAAARADAAWLLGARAESVPAPRRADVGAAIADALRRAVRAGDEAERAGRKDEAAAERRAATRAMWAARRIDRAAIRADAERLVGDAKAVVELRIEAALALAGTDARDALAAAMRDPSTRVRSAAASGLGASPPPDVMKLRGAPLDPAMLGVAAGHSFGAPPARGALAKDDGRRVHLPAALRAQDLAELAAVAKSGDAVDRRDAIAALGRGGGERAIEELRSIAFGKDAEDLKKAAYRAMRRAQRIGARDAARKERR